MLIQTLYLPYYNMHHSSGCTLYTHCGSISKGVLSDVGVVNSHSTEKADLSSMHRPTERGGGGGGTGAVSLGPPNV